MQRQLKNADKCKKNEIVKEALKETQQIFRRRKEGKKAKHNNKHNGKLQSKPLQDSVSPTQPPEHAKKKHYKDPDREHAQWQHW
jgi:hypothetical protein